MSERNDERYIENECIGLAIYCDENGLTVEEGIALAERIGEELDNTAADREFQR